MNILQVKYNSEEDKIKLLTGFNVMLELNEITGKIEGDYMVLNTTTVPYYEPDHYIFPATVFLMQAAHRGFNCVQILI